MVVALHPEIEDLGLHGGGSRDEMGVEEMENVLTDLGELRLHLGHVLSNGDHTLIVAPALILLLDGGDDSLGGPTGENHVLVGHGEQVALLHSKLLHFHAFGHLLHELHHLLVALCMLLQLHPVHILLTQ